MEKQIKRAADPHTTRELDSVSPRPIADIRGSWGLASATDSIDGSKCAGPGVFFPNHVLSNGAGPVGVFRSSLRRLDSTPIH